MSHRGPLRLVDGVPADALPADDRGLAYGDGVFETIAVVDGRPALWDAHLTRLEEGCRRLGFPPPARDDLAADLERLALSGHGVLRIQVTRGSGGQGYAPPAQPVPRRVLATLPLPQRPGAWWREGVAVRVCDTRLASQPRLAGIKHLNRLEQVLARAEWQDPEIAEGLMLAENGELIEATACNVLVHDGDCIRTPETRRCGVAGVMRDHLLGHLRRRGHRVLTQPLPLDRIPADAALLLCNSLIGLWPVRSLEGRPRPVSPLAATILEELVADGLVPPPPAGPGG